MKKRRNKLIGILILIFLIIALAIGSYIIYRNQVSADSFDAACYPNKRNCGQLIGKVFKGGSPLVNAKIDVYYSANSKIVTSTSSSGTFNVWLKVNTLYTVDVTPKVNGLIYPSNVQHFYMNKVTQVGKAKNQTFTYTGANGPTPTPAVPRTSTPTPGSGDTSVVTNPTETCPPTGRTGLIPLSGCNRQDGKYFSGRVVNQAGYPVRATLWLSGTSVNNTYSTDYQGFYPLLGPLLNGQYRVEVTATSCDNGSFNIQGSNTYRTETKNFQLNCSYLQDPNNKIYGTIKNSRNQVLPYTRVSLILDNRGIETAPYSVLTDYKGDYQINDITPGSYKIRVEASGCQSYTLDNSITVNANQERRWDANWINCTR